VIAKPNAGGKIVFVNRYFFPDQSATSQLLTDLASAIAESGLRVQVICSRQLYEDAGARLASHEWIGGVAVHRVCTTRFGRRTLAGRALDYATFYLSSALAMLGSLAPGDTLIAKTDPPLISIVAAAAAKIKRAHLVNWLQDIFPEVASLLGANPVPRSLDRLLRRLRDWSLHSARVNIVLGERMRERLERRGIPSARIQVVENWAERRPEAPKPASSSALRAKLGLAGEFVVSYSGNLGRAHEFHTLLGAAEILQSDRRFVFLMIGGGAGMTQLEREVRGRGLSNFRFLKYQPRESLGDALAAADVHWVSLRPALEGFIVPSKFYGILAAARPVVFIGDVDGELAREIGRSGCGAAVAAGDAPGLARVLRVWQSDPRLLEVMAGCAGRRYAERYCAERAFQKWLHMLTPSGPALDGSSPSLSDLSIVRKPPASG
jgi:colanic acid biosynthesis glycosyl transferase WcaI